MLQNSGSQAVTPQMLSKFARTARQRIRLEGGGYRRDHLRALAQRVEVAEGEVRIMGSKSRLLQMLVANGGVNAVPTQGLKWRRERRRLQTFADFSPIKSSASVAHDSHLLADWACWALARTFRRFGTISETISNLLRAAVVSAPCARRPAAPS